MTREWEDYDYYKDYDNLKYENRGNDDYFVDLMLNDGRILQMYKRDVNTLKYILKNGEEKRVYFIFSSKFLGKKEEVYSSNIHKIRLTHTKFERYKKHKTYYKGTCVRCGNFIGQGEAANIKCDILSFKYNITKGKYPKPEVEISFQKNEDSLLFPIY
jgi:hypothetical protein